MVALRGAIRVACFIIHVLSRAFADALLRREEMRHATFFCLRGWRAEKGAVKKDCDK